MNENAHIAFKKSKKDKNSCISDRENFQVSQVQVQSSQQYNAQPNKQVAQQNNTTSLTSSKTFSDSAILAGSFIQPLCCQFTLHLLQLLHSVIFIQPSITNSLYILHSLAKIHLILYRTHQK